MLDIRNHPVFGFTSPFFVAFATVPVLGTFELSACTTVQSVQRALVTPGAGPVLASSIVIERTTWCD